MLLAEWVMTAAEQSTDTFISGDENASSARVSRPTSSQEATRTQEQLRRAQAAAQQYRCEPASERRRLGVAGIGNSVGGQMPRGSQPTGLNLVNGGGPQTLQPPGLFN